MLPHVRLDNHVAPCRVEAAGDQDDRGVEAPSGELPRLILDSYGVVVDHSVDALVLVHERYPLSKCTHVVPICISPVGCIPLKILSM